MCVRCRMGECWAMPLCVCMCMHKKNICVCFVLYWFLFASMCVFIELVVFLVSICVIVSDLCVYSMLAYAKYVSVFISI